MEIHGLGRTIFNRSVTIGALPEPAPTLETDGYSILLTARPGGGFVPPYILILVDVLGGTNPTVTLDAYLRFPYARYLNRWQLIKRTIVSDDYSQSFTFMLVPTMGARRIDIKIHSTTGGPAIVQMHGRAINDDQAYLLLELQGSGGTFPLSNLPPLDVTTGPASAGIVNEASRQDHHHHIDFPSGSYRRFNQILIPTGDPKIFIAPATFIHGGSDTECVLYNGQRLLEGSGNDYVASESGGIGSGYDTITTEFKPRPSSNWLIDYVPA